MPGFKILSLSETIKIYQAYLFLKIKLVFNPIILPS